MKMNLTPLALALLLALPGGAQAQAAGQWKEPAVLFQRTCAYCHDQSLVKGVGPELLARGLPVDVITLIVRRGVGAMPAFPEAQIAPSELAALAAWIRDSHTDSSGRKAP